MVRSGISREQERPFDILSLSEIRDQDRDVVVLALMTVYISVINSDFLRPLTPTTRGARGTGTGYC